MNTSQRRWIDDQSILDSEKLWRHFKITVPDNLVRDETGQMIRPSSGVFRDRTDERSVDRASLTTLEKSFALKDPGNYIAEVEAGLCRKVGFVIVSSPTPDNPAHALICGNLKPARKNKTAERTLAENAMIRIPPC